MSRDVTSGLYVLRMASRRDVLAASTPSGPVDDRLRPESLTQLVTARLRDDILSGALVPGERLVEEQLTRRFSISRAPLREALRLLGEQGLVEHRPRRGSRVTTYSDRDFDEMFAIRDALERFALSQVADRPPHERDLAALDAALDDMRSAASSADMLTASQAHRAFHLALVALADNGQLLVTYEPLLGKLALHMAANLRREAEAASAGDGVRRHERLVDAVRSGDQDRIEDELRRHGARQFFH